MSILQFMATNLGSSGDWYRARHPSSGGEPLFGIIDAIIWIFWIIVIFIGVISWIKDKIKEIRISKQRKIEDMTEQIKQMKISFPDMSDQKINNIVIKNYHLLKGDE